MTVDERTLRWDLAEQVAGEVLFAWWMNHPPECEVTSGGACTCMTDIWFSGLRWTVCVTPDLRAFRHSLH